MKGKFWEEIVMSQGREAKIPGMTIAYLYTQTTYSYALVMKRLFTTNNISRRCQDIKEKVGSQIVCVKKLHCKMLITMCTHLSYTFNIALCYNTDSK